MLQNLKYLPGRQQFDFNNAAFSEQNIVSMFRQATPDNTNMPCKHDKSV